MATYKVIQDIEAEDKFLGPLTLKQFIFGAGGAFFAWLNFFAFTRGQTWLFTFTSNPVSSDFLTKTVLEFNVLTLNKLIKNI